MRRRWSWTGATPSTITNAGIAPPTGYHPSTTRSGNPRPSRKRHRETLHDFGGTTQLLFRLVAGAYERRSLAIGSHWPFEQWGRFLPEQTTAVSILDRLLHHATVVITDGPSLPHERRPTPKGAPLTNPGITPQGGDFHLANSGDTNMAIDSRLGMQDVAEAAELVTS